MFDIFAATLMTAARQTGAARPPAPPARPIAAAYRAGSASPVPERGLRRPVRPGPLPRR